MTTSPRRQARRQRSPAPEAGADRALSLRLASAAPSVKAGARWELVLSGWLEELGAAVTTHPAVQGLLRRPDLLAIHAGGLAYVEATATAGGDLLGHRQATAAERIHDVVMSRLKQKSRAFQGIDGPLVLAVLCVAEQADRAIVEAALDEFTSPDNPHSRNVSAVLVGWQLDEASAPQAMAWREHPQPRHPLPSWLAGGALAGH